MRRLVIKGDLGFEYWRDIEGYEGKYQVSTYGNIKSLNYHKTSKHKVLKGNLNGRGYLTVGLCKNGKQKNERIHIIVAKAFLPSKLPEQTEVNHISEVKTDNSVGNLEWCTSKENANWGTRTERVAKANTNHPNMSKPVLQFDLQGNFIAEYPSVSEAYRQIGVEYKNISACCLNKRNTAGGFRWKYLN